LEERNRVCARVFQSWTKIDLPYEEILLNRSQFVIKLIEIAEDRIVIMYDSNKRCHYFEVTSDDKLLGEKWRLGLLDKLESETPHNS